MTSRSPAAPTVAAGASAALLVVLLLDWHRTRVAVAGVAELAATSSGWHGWGVVAGIAALSVVVLVVRRWRPELLVAASLVALVATLLAALTGRAEVAAPVAGVRVEADAVLWPAWLGVALAAVAAAAALVALRQVDDEDGVAASHQRVRDAAQHG